MKIREQDLETFIALSQKAYGVTLTMDEAERELSKLLQLYALIYLSPIPHPEQVRPVTTRKAKLVSSIR